MYAPDQASIKDTTIVSAQRVIFPLNDAAFTHVGIYIGNGYIMDSTPAHQIALRKFEDSAAGMHVRALRLKNTGALTRWKIANTALNMRGSYNRIAAIADGLINLLPIPTGWKSLLAKLAVQKRAEDARYCGQFVNEAIFSVTGVSIVQGPILVPLPASFSTSSLFETVAIAW